MGQKGKPKKKDILFIIKKHIEVRKGQKLYALSTWNLQYHTWEFGVVRS